MNKIVVEIINEETPFLVAGKSVKTGEYVFGYPYFYKKVVKGKTMFCPCILLPTPVKGRIESDRSFIGRFLLRRYAIAFLNKEFHPVRPKDGLHKFVREDEGHYYFEDGIVITKKPA